MMVKRAVGESTTFSRRVAEEIDHAVRMSGQPAADIFAAAGMSRNYYYKRLRGEMPFNTNDIDRLGDALGINPFDLMRRATTNVTRADFGKTAGANVPTRGHDLSIAASDEDDWQKRQEEENE